MNFKAIEGSSLCSRCLVMTLDDHDGKADNDTLGENQQLLIDILVEAGSAGMAWEQLRDEYKAKWPEGKKWHSNILSRAKDALIEKKFISEIQGRFYAKDHMPADDLKEAA